MLRIKIIRLFDMGISTESVIDVCDLPLSLVQVVQIGVLSQPHEIPDCDRQGEEHCLESDIVDFFVTDGSTLNHLEAFACVWFVGGIKFEIRDEPDQNFDVEIDVLPDFEVLINVQLASCLVLVGEKALDVDWS